MIGTSRDHNVQVLVLTVAGHGKARLANIMWRLIGPDRQSARWLADEQDLPVASHYLQGAAVSQPNPVVIVADVRTPLGRFLGDLAPG